MSDGRDPISSLLGELETLSPSERVRRIKREGDVSRALQTLVDEATKLTTEETERAIRATDIVRSIADQLNQDDVRAQVRRARARALSYAGRFDEALATCSEAIGIAMNAGNLVEANRARLASMHALGELGRLEEAIAVGRAARHGFVEIGETMLAARADINLGIALQKCDRPREALECLERARPELLNDSTFAPLENARGEVFYALNEFENAEVAFQSAIDASNSRGAGFLSAIYEGNLADLAAREGLLRKALYHFEGARRHLEESRSTTHIARLRAEEADAVRVLGLPYDAERMYREAIDDLDQCGLTLEAARARSGLGEVLLRLGRVADAETALAAASIAFHELEHTTSKARVDIARAEIMRNRGRLNEAKRLGLTALGVLHDRPVDQVAVRFLLARIEDDLGDRDSAELEYRQALRTAYEFDLVPMLAALLDARGRMRAEAYQFPEAETDLREAVECIERMRGSLQASRFRSAWLGERVGTHELLIDVILHQDAAVRAGEALEVAEQARARTLLDQIDAELIEGGDESSDGSDDLLVNDMLRVKRELNAFYSRLADATDDAPNQIELYSRSIQERERELAELEHRLASRRSGSTWAAQCASAHEIQRAVGEGQVLIEYVFCEDACHAFVARRSGIAAVRNVTTKERLSSSLQRLLFQIDRALRPEALARERGERLVANAQRELNDLYGQLITPLAAHLDGVRSLIVSPQGPLNRVPFHALWDGEQYLIERFETSAVPSASLLAHLREEDRTCSGDLRALFIAIADEQAPMIEQEAEYLQHRQGRFEMIQLVGDRATRESVVANSTNARLIHLASHARFVADNPVASGVRLADGWLTVREISELRLQARLVVLSGCETGLTEVQSGEELSGLLRSLLTAGAQSAMASLWRVEDAAGAGLLRRFYEHWLPEGTDATELKSPAHALRLAMREQLREQPHPALWAPFTLVGLP